MQPDDWGLPLRYAPPDARKWWRQPIWACSEHSGVLAATREIAEHGYNRADSLDLVHRHLRGEPVLADLAVPAALHGDV